MKNILINTLIIACIYAVIAGALYLSAVSANAEGGYCSYQEQNRGNINNILCY